MGQVAPFHVDDKRFWHVRVYLYALMYERGVPWRENFCHYWRTVIVWAPLTWFFEAGWARQGLWLVLR